MLTKLAIHNVVLIDRLTLDTAAGLSALTGETGAGKSILLDALGLALGARADAKLVRHGEAQASVTASFDLPTKHPAWALLIEKELPQDDTLILRRTLGTDGKSKAFINDAPVTVQFLKEVGAALIEIHGQFETQGLLDPATHGQVLDSYAGILPDVTKTRHAWQHWQAAQRKIDDLLANIEVMRQQEEYLKFTVAELEKLSPITGEEMILAEKRSRLLNREKLQGAFDTATSLLENEGGMQDILGQLQTTLQKLNAKAPEQITPLLDGLNRIDAEISEISYQIEGLKSGRGQENERLEDIEERYFAIRECAKKHRCNSDDLPTVLADLAQKLKLITHQDDALADLKRDVANARKEYIAAAEKLSLAREKAAAKISKAVNAELPDLKLDKAKFTVACDKSTDETQWGPEGFERTQFMVSTNPNTPAGPIHKIASGGELSRFMLALKVIIAATSTIPTLIFDEVDSGIGGATADAVGERIARLAKKYQILVVTHSPQVASRATQHFIVAKTEAKGNVTTKITPLKTMAERAEEIARMISGAKISTEARAAATKLLENHLVSDAA